MTNQDLLNKDGTVAAYTLPFKGKIPEKVIEWECTLEQAEKIREQLIKNLEEVIDREKEKYYNEVC
jgi:hypothetical protein